MDDAERILLGLSSIFVLGIGAQWIAWRLRLPSILLLLAFGFLAGPVSGWLDPDAMFGDLLFPLVSLCVGLILFEGSLGLKFAELADVGGTLRSLLSIGVLVTWVAVALAAHWILGFEWPIAILLGSMLTVTGPTVVGPLLRHIRPTGRIGPIARKASSSIPSARSWPCWFSKRSRLAADRLAIPSRRVFSDLRGRGSSERSAAGERLNCWPSP